MSIFFCVQCYYGCHVYLMAGFISPNDSNDQTGPISYMYKITSMVSPSYNYCRDVAIHL